MRRTIKVVHVAETTRGGIASYLRDLIPLQVKEYGAERIVVIVPEDHVSDLRLPDGVQSLTFSSSYRNIFFRFFNSIKAAFLTMKLLDLHKVENIHLHSSFAGLAVRIAIIGRNRTQKIIYCPHGWAFLRKSRLEPLEIWVERQLDRFTDHIVCVSKHEQHIGLKAGIREELLVLIPNGISTQAPAPLSIASPWPEDNRLKLLFIGRFDRQKGIDILLDIVRNLQEKVFLCAAGSCIVGKQFLKQPPDNVVLLDWQKPESVSMLLNQCDALVMPSRWEGMPITALEAMRAGKAVIGSDIPGLNEVIVNGFNGRLIPVHDNDAWTSYLTDLTPRLCQEMGQNGRLLFDQKFDIVRTHCALVELYESSAEKMNTRTRTIKDRGSL